MSNDNRNTAVNKVQGVAQPQLTNSGNKLENELGPALSSAISTQLSQPNRGASNPLNKKHDLNLHRPNLIKLLQVKKTLKIQSRI